MRSLALPRSIPVHTLPRLYFFALPSSASVWCRSESFLAIYIPSRTHQNTRAYLRLRHAATHVLWLWFLFPARDRIAISAHACVRECTRKPPLHAAFVGEWLTTDFHARTFRYPLLDGCIDEWHRSAIPFSRVLFRNHPIIREIR